MKLYSFYTKTKSVYTFIELEKFLLSTTMSYTHTLLGPWSIAMVGFSWGNGNLQAIIRVGWDEISCNNFLPNGSIYSWEHRS